MHSLNGQLVGELVQSNHVGFEGLHEVDPSDGRDYYNIAIFTDSSLRASQQRTKTQGVTLFYRQFTPSKPTAH